MAKIFFNNSVVKELPEPTIIEFFSQSDGKSIFLRDIRRETYKGRRFIVGDVRFYIDGKGDYRIDIEPLRRFDATVYGVYSAQGTDFSITAPNGKGPIFVARQKGTVLSLGTRPDLQAVPLDSDENAIGMFHVGTVISYKRDGVPIKDELRKTGWVRIAGPSDVAFGIMTVEEAIGKKEERAKKNAAKKADEDAEFIARIEAAKASGDINPVLADELIAARRNTDPNHIFMFRAQEIKDLKRRNLI